MRILPITQKITAEIKKVENARKVESSPKTRVLPSDHSDISSNAQRLSETNANIDIVLNQVSNEPEIRQEKVDEVRKKIENGYYDSADFADKLAEKLLSDFGVKTQE